MIFCITKYQKLSIFGYAVINGAFNAFDEDFEIKVSGMVKVGVNYNWKFNNMNNLVNFVNQLQKCYNILWVYKNGTITIFSIRNKPDIKLFNNDELELYKKLIGRVNKKQ